MHNTPTRKGRGAACLLGGDSVHHTLIAQSGEVPGLILLAFPATREGVEAVIEALIERLDASDGDPDSEADGDELDGTGAEDDFCQFFGIGPGCPVSDPGEPDHEDDARQIEDWAR